MLFNLSNLLNNGTIFLMMYMLLMMSMIQFLHLPAYSASCQSGEKKVAISHIGRQMEEPGADTNCMTQPLSKFPIPGVMVR